MRSPLVTGTIFDIKKFAIHDGPGVRTTVFFKGCPLRCWGCHNPESQSPERELVYREERCRLCGDCVAACPAEALALDQALLRIDRDRCTLCGACGEACVAGAIELVGRSVTVAEVMAEVEKDRVFYEESGGGVTFSGGEPLAQPAFLEALLAACREQGIHTAVDTCGYAPAEVIRRIGDRADLFLYDLKLMPPQRHCEFTGERNEQILENLRYLADRGRPVILRYPVFSGINDDEENVSRLAAFAASLPAVPPLDLLPYHRGGTEKYARSGRPYRLPGMRPPPEDRLAEIAQTLREAGLRVTIRGG